MEFVDLSRYLSVKDPVILPFSKLRLMKPVLMTQDLQLVDEADNISYAESLTHAGMEVAAIKRIPNINSYANRDFFPRRILFEMTSKCNFLCRMCPQQDLRRPRMDMPSELYGKIIDEIDSYGVEGIWLYHLGESLLHPEFIKNLRHVSTKKNLGIIWISTNGRYCDEEKIRLMLDSNIDYVNFSVHAVSEEVYDTVAPKGNFSFVQGNLDKFYELKGVSRLPRKPFIHCQMIEQETTKGEVDAFIKKHYKRAEIVSVNMLEYANFPNNSFGLSQRKRLPLSSCLRVSRNDCFIFSNGDVTLCDAAYNGEINLGNIKKQGLYDVWNGEKRKDILKLNNEGLMNKIEFCSSCTDYDI